MRIYAKYKPDAIALRRMGKTYSEIKLSLKIKIPSSTLCTWFKNIELSREEKESIALHSKERIRAGSEKASATKAAKRKQREEKIILESEYLLERLDEKDIAKISLVMLYLCEGSKYRRSSLCFANSDPGTDR